VAAVAPAGIVTPDGTVSAPLLLAMATERPPEGAACDTFAVHDAVDPEFTEFGVHVTEVTLMTGCSVMLTLFATPAVAVTCAVVVVDTTDAFPANPVDNDPAATVTDTGMMRLAELLVIVTVIPPAGAAAVNVAVQVVAPDPVIVVGLQLNELSCGVMDTEVVSVPPVPVIATELPAADAATVPPTPIVRNWFVELVLGVALTTATIPSPIVAVLTP
jgi:hypothetical protein